MQDKLQEGVPHLISSAAQFRADGQLNATISHRVINLSANVKITTCRKWRHILAHR